MITKEKIIDAALKNGFEDVGFTTAEPFDSHREFLQSKTDEYGWADKILKLNDGIDPKNILHQYDHCLC